MRIFAIRIELPNFMAMQRLHEGHARQEHPGSTTGIASPCRPSGDFIHGQPRCSLNQIGRDEYFKIVPMKCGRGFIPVEPDADAIGVNATSDDRAHLIRETRAP